jgi:hypothetical protein
MSMSAVNHLVESILHQETIGFNPLIGKDEFVVSMTTVCTGHSGSYGLHLEALDWSPIDSPNILCDGFGLMLDRMGIEYRVSEDKVKMLRFYLEHPISASDVDSLRDWSGVGIRDYSFHEEGLSTGISLGGNAYTVMAGCSLPEGGKAWKSFNPNDSDGLRRYPERYMPGCESSLTTSHFVRAGKTYIKRYMQGDAQCPGSEDGGHWKDPRLINCPKPA